MVNRRKGYKLHQQITYDEMKEYGEYFRNMRKSIGFTLDRMSEELGIIRSTLWRWEKGKIIPRQDIDEIVDMMRYIVKQNKKHEKVVI